MPSFDHVIVLMLENRSFDHMLGYLRHQDPSFRGVPIPPPTNPDSNGQQIPTRPTATGVMRADGGHHHVNVMHQLTGQRRLSNGAPINSSGFVTDYGDVLRDKGENPGFGALIMDCHHERNVPALARLALDFAVCDNWFSAVPGATWPNREFALCGTSGGRVDNKVRLIGRRTIFRVLEEAAVSWRVYHEGLAQAMSFQDVFTHRRYGSHDELLEDIAAGRLPAFAFVEPKHLGRHRNSQHPANNLKHDRDFRAGEQLIASIYSALRQAPHVFERTVFLVTYDEHGGLYDHVHPPRDASYRDGRSFEDDGYRFDFDLLGVRVPAVVVSPYVARGTVDHTVYDHTSISATVRHGFAPGAEPLSPREARANRFDRLLTLDVPRVDEDLPHLEPLPVPEEDDWDADEPVSFLDDLALGLLEMGVRLRAQLLGGPDSMGLRDATRDELDALATVRDAAALQDRLVAALTELPEFG